MRKIFYTGSDIEELAASGITRLELGPGMAITDIARQVAEELGIELAQPDGANSKTASKAAPAARVVESSAGRPRGCQHGPLTDATHSAIAADPGKPDGVVNKLVDMVSRLAKQGG